MKPTGEKRGFTIIELLTVMSIIIILISLLVPSLNRVRRVAKGVAQRAQFYDIERALEEYQNANDDEFPDSSQFDTDEPNEYYCGAMKLAEVMIGQDGMGLHEDSLMHADGLDADDTIIYIFNLSAEIPLADAATPLGQFQRDNIGRRIKYLENDDIGRCKLGEIFSDIGKFNDTLTNAVLCDVFTRTQILSGDRLGEKVGMPVLYYKADVRKLMHDFDYAEQSIYDYKDNIDLLDLGLPWDSSGLEEHPIAADPCEFYEVTQNEDIITTPTPYKKNQYILISAGYDGRYGTRDDIFNFRR